jgi:hypothetical protein
LGAYLALILSTIPAPLTYLFLGFLVPVRTNANTDMISIKPQQLLPNSYQLFITVFSKLSRHKDVWGSGDIAAAFLTSVLDKGELSGSWPRPFYPRYQFIGGWVDCKAGLDAVEW